MSGTDKYVSPLSERYASKEMQYIFSPDMKFRTWRKLWIALAETEKELGLPITDEQIEELKSHAEDINYEVAKEREKIVRHDVMSHVYAYGVQCPEGKRNHPPGSNFLLCRRQYGHHRDERGPEAGPQKAYQRHRRAPQLSQINIKISRPWLSPTSSRHSRRP